MKALSRALSNERNTRLARDDNTHNQTGAADATTSTYTVATQPTHQTTEGRLFTMCGTVNNRVHSAIDNLLQRDKAQPLDLSTIDLDGEIAMADQRLITRTREERNNPLSSY